VLGLNSSLVVFLRHFLLGSGGKIETVEAKIKVKVAEDFIGAVGGIKLLHKVPIKTCLEVDGPLRSPSLAFRGPDNAVVFTSRDEIFQLKKNQNKKNE